MATIVMATKPPRSATVCGPPGKRPELSMRIFHPCAARSSLSSGGLTTQIDRLIPPTSLCCLAQFGSSPVAGWTAQQTPIHSVLLHIDWDRLELDD